MEKRPDQLKVIPLAHLLTTIAKLVGPGGAKAVVADSLSMRQQLLVINRARLCWNANDPAQKLDEFRQYYNAQHVHTALDDTTPAAMSDKSIIRLVDLSQFQWKSHCRDLYQPPVAA